MMTGDKSNTAVSTFQQGKCSERTSTFRPGGAFSGAALIVVFDSTEQRPLFEEQKAGNARLTG